MIAHAHKLACNYAKKGTTSVSLYSEDSLKTVPIKSHKQHPQSVQLYPIERLWESNV